MMADSREAIDQTVQIEHDGSNAIIRLNSPAQRNSLSISTLEKLDQVVTTLTQQADLSALIFTGVEDVFASGADIRELAALTPETAGAFAKRGQALFDKISNASQFTVAAINGYCMGGGLDFALACDMRCASSNAVFAHPGARLGIITGWGGTQRLPRLIGQARAMDILLTARRVTSTEALEVGLVNRVGDPVLQCAINLCAEVKKH
jgi:enoyl-CoA hydratase